MTQNRVIELIRVSTEEQAADSRASIPSQRAVNRETERRYGLTIVRSVKFWDVSGTSVLLSPEVQEVLRLMESPDIHGVVAREFSRVMRPENYADFALLQAFVDTRTLLYLPDGPIDFASRSGRMLGTMQAVWAGIQRIDFLELTWNAKEQMRGRGQNANGRACLPLGVSYDPASGFRYTPDAEKVRDAVRLMLAGNLSYRDVGRRVGVNENTLKGAVRNPIYKGWRVIDKKRDPSPQAKRVRPDGRQGDRPKIPRPAHEVIRVRVIDEPLISEAEFDRLQVMLDAKRRAHWKTDPGYLLTYNGLLFCTCGQIYYAKRVRCGYYRCRGRAELKTQCRAPYMRRDLLDSALDRLFAERLTDRGFLTEAAKELARRSAQPDAGRAERLLRQLDSLSARRERILDAYFNEGLITPAERDERLRVVDAELTTTRSSLEGGRPAPEVSARTLASLFRPFRRFAQLPRPAKRKLLLALAPEVRVRDYRVESLGLRWGGSSVHRTAATTATGRPTPR
ncbi:MAG TPA: recombinase family protein [Pyrinomonadaceae bacterium]|nr:recombinase family protein [Pyrinomonadaceae bacterium]